MLPRLDVCQHTPRLINDRRLLTCQSALFGPNNRHWHWVAESRNLLSFWFSNWMTCGLLSYRVSNQYRAWPKGGPQVACMLQAGSGRSVKQEQLQNSPNLGNTFYPSPVFHRHGSLDYFMIYFLPHGPSQCYPVSEHPRAIFVTANGTERGKVKRGAIRRKGCSSSCGHAAVNNKWH